MKKAWEVWSSWMFILSHLVLTFTLAWLRNEDMMTCCACSCRAFGLTSYCCCVTLAVPNSWSWTACTCCTSAKRTFSCSSKSVTTWFFMTIINEWHSRISTPSFLTTYVLKGVHGFICIHHNHCTNSYLGFGELAGVYASALQRNLYQPPAEWVQHLWHHFPAPISWIAWAQCPTKYAELPHKPVSDSRGTINKIQGRTVNGKDEKNAPNLIYRNVKERTANNIKTLTFAGSLPASWKRIRSLSKLERVLSSGLSSTGLVSRASLAISDVVVHCRQKCLPAHQHTYTDAHNVTTISEMWSAVSKEYTNFQFLWSS